MNCYKKRLALGKVVLSDQAIMQIVARGTHVMEVEQYLPKLPKGVTVRSVHTEPTTLAHIFILESAEPVEGWTEYVEPGVQIPLSKASMNTMQKVVDNRKDPEFLMRTLSLRCLIANIDNDIKDGRDSGINLNMTIEEYLLSLYNEE